MSAKHATHARPYIEGAHILGRIAVKRCSSCWVTKPLSEFSDDCTKTCGMRSDCRKCEAKARAMRATSWQSKGDNHAS